MSVSEIIVSSNLEELAKELNVSYLSLLLGIWFNMRNLTVDRIIHTTATDTRKYSYHYNAFGEKIKEELDNLLQGASWEYTGPDIYSADRNKRNGKSQLIINTPSRKFVISSSDSFDPQITIAGARRKDDYLSSVVQLPDPLGKVEVHEI